MESPEAGLDQPGTSGTNKKNEKALLARVWGNFDSKLVKNFSKILRILRSFAFFRYMKPLLTNSRPTLFETLPACCTPLARILTTTEQLTQTGPTRKLDSDSDLCIDDANPNGTRRNSISRVSIRLDEGYMASYKNRE